MTRQARAGLDIAALAAAARALTPRELAAGAEWWIIAREDVAELADRHGVRYRTCALAAAALSPGLRWDATLEVLGMLLDARAAGATEFPVIRSGHLTFGHRDRAKAWAILTGGPEAEARCSGPKVTAIAANLLGDMERVAVDRHVIRAATGTDQRQVSPAQLGRIEAAVQVLAYARGVAPAALQAALWLAAR